jgi:Amt family ammonium transporter
LVVYYAINKAGWLRLKEEDELYGIDLQEHGIPAYPEYVISSVSTPSGLSKDLTGSRL